MASVRSQLFLVALFAAICAVSAKNLTAKEWGVLMKQKHKVPYNNWCQNQTLCTPKLLDVCRGPLSDMTAALMEEHGKAEVIDLHFQPVFIIMEAEFCDAKEISVTSTPVPTTSSPTNATDPPSPTFVAAPSSPATVPSGNSTPAGTTDMTTQGTASTDRSNTSLASPGVSSSTGKNGSVTTTASPSRTPAPKSDGTNPLYWILPVITLVLIAMVIGGIYLYRYTKKAGYHHSSKSNGEAAKGTGEAA